jgi:hypothetical protein
MREVLTWVAAGPGAELSGGAGGDPGGACMGRRPRRQPGWGRSGMEGPVGALGVHAWGAGLGGSRAGGVAAWRGWWGPRGCMHGAQAWAAAGQGALRHGGAGGALGHGHMTTGLRGFSAWDGQWQFKSPAAMAS